MHKVLKAFKPEDFDVDNHYWSTFEDHSTECAARWVVMFLQERGKGWEPFTAREITEFYQRKTDKAGAFPFAQLLPGTHVRYINGERKTVTNKHTIDIEYPEWDSSQSVPPEAKLHVTKLFVLTLLMGDTLIEVLGEE